MSPADVSQNPDPLRNRGIRTFLLCIPSWGVVIWAVLFVLSARTIPSIATGPLMSKTAIYLAVFCAVVGPFCWLAAVITNYRRREKRPAIWGMLIASGVAVIGTWVVLEHFAKAR